MIINYQIKIQSVNKKALDLYLQSVQLLLKTLNLNYTSFNLPIKKKRITLLKSPHVNKTAREQFEINNYKNIITLKKLPADTKVLKLLALNKPKIITLSIKSL
jgi:small subunit ribosomal protein S10